MLDYFRWARLNDKRREQRERNQVAKAKEAAELNLGSGSRIKFVQGNTCVMLEPEITSVCWDAKNKGGAVLVDELSGDDLKKFLSGGIFVIFNKDRSKIVGIEIT